MYDAEEWRLDALSLTLNWAHSRKELPQQPRGDVVEVSKRLYNKYVGNRSQGPPCNASQLQDLLLMPDGWSIWDFGCTIGRCSKTSPRCRFRGTHWGINIAVTGAPPS